MNRHERRRQEREGKKLQPIRMVKESEIYSTLEKKADAISYTATKEAVSVLTKIFAYTLNIECGFGKYRINKILSRAKYQLECISAGTVSGNDIADYLERKKINAEV